VVLRPDLPLGARGIPTERSRRTTPVSRPDNRTERHVGHHLTQVVTCASLRRAEVRGGGHGGVPHGVQSVVPSLPQARLTAVTTVLSSSPALLQRGSPAALRRLLPRPGRPVQRRTTLTLTAGADAHDLISPVWHRPKAGAEVTATSGLGISRPEAFHRDAG
jgi:hypothetical protein